MFTLMLVLEVGIVGGLLIIQPYVVRRGLLFGVYVGEERWASDEARATTRQWISGMLAGMVGGVLLAVLIVGLRLGPEPVGLLVSVLVVLLTSYGVYLRAYFRAKRMAVPGAPPAAAALVADPPHGLWLPLLSLTIAVGAGAVAVAHAWLHYQEMPAVVPTHFGLSGQPDAWSPRAFGSVMMLPIAALLVPGVMAVTACLTARAKRAIRMADNGVSLAAQVRFRGALTTFLSTIVILLSVMMCGMSITVVRTAVGLEGGIPAWWMALTIVLLTYAVGGTLYLAFRYGQGGARLERQAAGARLTNGVADNSCWYLGGFYVNRNDPSILVEKRFGIGYTLNFGNPKAVALFVVLLAVIAVIVVNGLMTPQTHTAPTP